MKLLCLCFKALFIILLASSCSIKRAKDDPLNVIKSSFSSSQSLFSSYYARCDGRVQSVGTILEPIVKNMVAQKIPYSQSPSSEWRDCSGNFLRLSSYLASACPEQKSRLAAPAGIRHYKKRSNNSAPGLAKARTSKQLAAWYSKQGRFTPIYYDGVKTKGQASDDLKRKRHLIKVGAVLWYSRKAPSKRSGLSGLIAGINHMAVVTSVSKDKRGDVTHYKVFHGRNKGKVATVTHQHFWVWPMGYLSRGREYPPLGYWGQRLVGVGALLAEAKSP